MFVVIYEKYRYLMMKVAHDVLKDNFLAEDAVHEAFIKIAHNMQNIHDVESVETKRYLIIVAKNAAIDIYRSRKKQMKEEMFIDELGEDAGPITYLKTDIDNEILDILKNAVFDPVFNHFLQVMTDGNFINLTEDKLKLIDQIDIFYSGKESQLPVSKPFFIKLALNYLGDKLVEFNKLPSNMKQNLIHLWNNELEKHQNS